MGIRSENASSGPEQASMVQVLVISHHRPDVYCSGEWMVALGLDESSDRSPRYSWPCGGVLQGDDNVQTALRLLRQHLGIQARRGDLQFVGIEDRWTDELDSKAVGIASYVLSLCDTMPEISSQKEGLPPRKGIWLPAALFQSQLSKLHPSLKIHYLGASLQKHLFR